VRGLCDRGASTRRVDDAAPLRATRLCVVVVGAQVRPRTPQYSFGHESRDAADRGGRSVSPGPGAYQTEHIDSVTGRTATSTHVKSPITKFGSSGRFEGAARDGPAPGAYGVVEDKRFATAPRAVFGTSSRGDERGPGGPAPGDYTGRVDSVRPRSAQFRFGTGEWAVGCGMSWRLRLRWRCEIVRWVWVRVCTQVSAALRSAVAGWGLAHGVMCVCALRRRRRRGSRLCGGGRRL